MERSEIIDAAMQTQAYKDNTLTYIDVCKIADFSNKEIEFVKLFYDIVTKQNFLYVTREMIVDWFNYSRVNAMCDFYTNLKKNYKIDIEYKQINTYIPTYYYRITGRCLKLLLWQTQSPCSKFIREMYIKTQDIVSIMQSLHKTN